MKSRKTPILILSFLLISLFAAAQADSIVKEETYYTAEKMPEYPGGMEALYKLIRNNLLYPDTTTEAAKEGRVILRFIISSSGEVKEITILKGLNKECDEEALRVMKLVPKWVPAQQEGKNVAIYNTLPIYFKRLNPVLQVDGIVKPYKFLKDSILNKKDEMESMTILREETARTIYGDLGKTGAIIVLMKKKPEMDDEIKNKEDSSKIAYGVEVMPQFPGGEKRLLQFIRDNLNYPYAAADLGMQGRVDIRFIVTATGELTDIRVIKSLNPVLDAVAVRTVRKMPNWIPGIQNGKAVPVYYILPIIFTLQQ